MKTRIIHIAVIVAAIIAWSGATAAAQTITQKPGVPAGLPGSLKDKLDPPQPIVVPPDYTIGVDDVLTVNVFNDTVLSGDVVVRPDGKITLAYGNDIMALGLRPEELKTKVFEEIKKAYDEPPAITVVVKQINSRWVYITGAIGKPGRYPVTGAMTLIQLVAMAGGLQEYADDKNIMIISATLKDKNGQPLTMKANYKDALRGRNLNRNNPELRPGDQVVIGGGF